MSARPVAERVANPSRPYHGQLRSPASIERLRAISAARQRALRVVARMYGAEFAAAWTDRGHKDDPGYDARRDAAERSVAANHPDDFERAFAAEKHPGRCGVTGRCVATNPAGARCTLGATHGNDHHAYASYAYHFGKLQEAVRGYLERGASREFLAAILAEVDAEAGR